MNNNVKITAYLSDKIKVLSFVSILMVVYIHTYYTEGENMPCLMFLEKAWGMGICRIAVPLFYAISGYLFFLNTDSGLPSVFTKMKRRIQTLLVPYLLANTLAALFLMALNVVCDLVPAIGSVVNYRILDCFRHNGLLQSLYDIYYAPVAFQLWFMRDLMVVVACSPAIYVALKYLAPRKSGLAVLFAAEAVLLVGSVFNGYAAAFGWFVLGGILVMSPRINIANVKPLYGVVCGAVYIAAVVLYLLDILHGKYMHIATVFGVPAIWILYDAIAKGRLLSERRFWKTACSYTFFIYLTHEPFLNIFKKLPLLISRNESMLMASYIAVPIIFCAIACGGGYLAKSYIPKLYCTYTGGR